MCLSIIKKVLTGRGHAREIAYKAVKRPYKEVACYMPLYVANHLRWKIGGNYKDRRRKPIIISRWLKDREYPTGFHFFTNVKSAKHHVRHSPKGCVLKCEIKKITARGIQWGRHVVVAREFNVIEKVA